MGNYHSALQQHDRVLSVCERELPAKHPDRIRAKGRKAGALPVGRLDESLALFQAAMKLGRRVFEVDSSALLALEANAATTLSQTGLGPYLSPMRAAAAISLTFLGWWPGPREL